MERLGFLCEITAGNNLLVAVITAVVAVICGAASRFVLQLLWRGKQVEHVSASGFGFGCLLPFGVALGIAGLVACILPGVEACASTDVIGYRILAFVVASPSVLLSYYISGKFKSDS